MTSNDPFNRMLHEPPGGLPTARGAVAAPARFPLGLCILGITSTSSGLLAAALSVKWGAAPPTGDALPFAWLYVNVMLAFTWLIVWPAVALRPNRTGGPALTRLLVNDAAALAIAAVPALGTAAFLSDIINFTTTLVVFQQAGIALFSMGVLAVSISGRDKYPTLPGLAAGLLATLTCAAPVFAFLWSNFFPRAPQGWSSALPLVAIHRAARNTSSSNAGWWIAAAYAFVGTALILVSIYVDARTRVITSSGSQTRPGT